MSHKYFCQTPSEKCSGGLYEMTKPLKRTRAHTSPIDGFRCTTRYLLKEGWTQLSKREFLPPNGEGPIRVLSRPGKFGSIARGGKTGEKSSTRGKRFIPMSGRSLYIA